MTKQRIPLITTEMYRHLPDQTTEILNRLINDVNEYQDDITELTNAIIMLRKMIKDLPTPTPSGEWNQLLYFDPNRMGHTAGMCLQNTREGFGITSGTFPSARADMNSQIANGTLHAGYPPSDIAVPIYYDNSVPDGHAAAWDHGKVYSDGVQYANIDAIDAGYAGWGELCDGARVVEKRLTE